MKYNKKKHELSEVQHINKTLRKKLDETVSKYIYEFAIFSQHAYRSEEFTGGTG